MTSPVLPTIYNQSAMAATGVRTFRDRQVAWQTQGLSTCVVDALASGGIDTDREITWLGRTYFKSRPNLEPKTLREPAVRSKERLTAAGVIAAALSLSLLSDDACETVVDAVIAPRRNGFQPFSFKSGQAW